MVSDSKDVAEEKALWLLGLLRSALRYGGVAIVENRSRIQELIQLLLSSEDASYQKMGAKLLSSALLGLCETYLLDWRATPPSQRDFAPPGYGYDASHGLEPTWHSPSEAELGVLSEFVASFSQEPINRLGNLNHESFDRASVIRDLRIIRAVIQGAFEAMPRHEATEEKSSNDSGWLPIPNLQPMAISSSQPPNALGDLRRGLEVALHAAAQSIATVEDVKSSKLISRTIENLLAGTDDGFSYGGFRILHQKWKTPFKKVPRLFKSKLLKN